MKWSTTLERAKLARKDGGLQDNIRIERDDIEHPYNAGFRLSLGLPRGQLRDWRLRDGRGCLHVLEYPDHYLAHWDAVDPLTNPIEHFILDVVRFFVRGLAAFILLLLSVTMG